MEKNSKEKLVNYHLVKAYELFLKLPRQHPDELRDFVDGIHRCQYLMGMRVARKYLPKEYPIKNKVEYIKSGFTDKTG